MFGRKPKLTKKEIVKAIETVNSKEKNKEKHLNITGVSVTQRIGTNSLFDISIHIKSKTYSYAATEMSDIDYILAELKLKKRMLHD